jgi:peptidoglycan/LPS O-acetylase OafA/YrhL
MSEAHARYPQSIPSLDGIRAVSVLIVVLAHSGFEVVPGGLGVTIFFFLSGYLITTLMLAESERSGRLSIPKFYARRVFRLMPPLFITLAVAYALTFSGLLPGGITAAGLAAQFLYFANYYGIFFDPGNTIPTGTGILWSLAVEEHFYIFYPLLMSWMLAGKTRPVTIGTMLGLACVAILAWRLYLVQSPGFVPIRTYYASDTRIDSIIYGCILAIVVNPVRDLDRIGAMSPRHWGLLAVAGATLLATLLYRSESFREGLRYTLQGLALLPVFYLAIRFSTQHPFRPLNWPLVKKIGVYSYAIYLIHHVVIGLAAANAPAIASRPYLMFPIAMLASVAFAAVVDRYIDPYFRQLRHEFRPGARAASDALGDGR